MSCSSAAGNVAALLPPRPARSRDLSPAHTYHLGPSSLSLPNIPRVFDSTRQLLLIEFSAVSLQLVIACNKMPFLSGVKVQRAAVLFAADSREKEPQRPRFCLSGALTPAGPAPEN